jgi:hypothetical protein
MKKRKVNFPNIQNVLEDKLNIADTFTSKDTHKIIDLFKTYYNLDNDVKKIYYRNTINYILENKQLDLSKINEEDKFILLMYVIESDDNKITDNYLKLRNTGLTEDMIERAENSMPYYDMAILTKLKNKLMKIKAHEEPIMQAEFISAWKPTGQEMPKELQFNMLSYLQPNAKPTPSGITHDDVMRNTIENLKGKYSSSSSNTLGGRRRTRRFKKSMKRRTMRRK